MFIKNINFLLTVNKAKIKTLLTVSYIEKTKRDREWPIFKNGESDRESVKILDLGKLNFLFTTSNIFGP